MVSYSLRGYKSVSLLYYLIYLCARAAHARFHWVSEDSLSS